MISKVPDKNYYHAVASLRSYMLYVHSRDCSPAESKRGNEITRKYQHPRLIMHGLGPAKFWHLNLEL